MLAIFAQRLEKVTLATAEGLLTNARLREETRRQNKIRIDWAIHSQKPFLNVILDSL